MVSGIKNIGVVLLAVALVWGIVADSSRICPERFVAGAPKLAVLQFSVDATPSMCPGCEVIPAVPAGCWDSAPRGCMDPLCLNTASVMLRWQAAKCLPLLPAAGLSIPRGDLAGFALGTSPLIRFRVSNCIPIYKSVQSYRC